MAQKIDEFTLSNKDLQFKLDESLVINIKLDKEAKRALESEEEQKRIAAKETNEKAIVSGENEQLRTKLKELVEVSDTLARKFEELQNGVLVQKKEANFLKDQLDHAKNLFSKLNTDNSQLITQLEFVTKQRNEALEKIRHSELVINRKDRELAELVNKVNETIQDYEGMLKKKDEQLWTITEKFQEEVAQSKLGQTELEKEKCSELERKMEAQARAFQHELDSVRLQLDEKDTEITKLCKTIRELEFRQFEPRMERLHAIEKDFKLHLEEYMLSEESLENGLICPKCLHFFTLPHTLIPCGHTYCKECIEEMKDMHYNQWFCAECPQLAVEHVFRNEALESLTERFNRRKSMVLSMISWIKVLKVFVPDTTPKEIQLTTTTTTSNSSTGAAKKQLLVDGTSS